MQQQKGFATVAVLSAIAERGCRFIVGGRAMTTHTHEPPAAAVTASATATSTGADSGSVFDTMQSVLAGAALALPPDLEASLFTGLSEDEFRVDLSSTQIRAAAAGAAAAGG